MAGLSLVLGSSLIERDARKGVYLLEKRETRQEALFGLEADLGVELPSMLGDGRYRQATGEVGPSLMQWIHLGTAFSGGLVLALSAMLLLVSNRRNRTQQEAICLGKVALLDTKRLLDTVLSSTHDCIKVLDPNGIILSINNAACRKFGIERPDEVVGRAWDGLWCEDRSSQVRDALATARLGRVARFTAPIPHEDGSLRWWYVVISPVFAPDNRLVQLVAVSHDVTIADPCYVASQNSEVRLRAIADTAKKPI